MYSDKVRYFRVDGGMIYIFYLTQRMVCKYGFKPYNKRKRFRDSRLFFSSRRFYLLSQSAFTMSDPLEYINFRCRFGWKEFRIGDYL